MRAFLIVGFAFALAGCSQAPAGPVSVIATSAGTPHFDPATVDVKVGGTVHFHVESGHHTVDFNATDGLSNGHSGELGPLTSDFGVVFAKKGTFPFHCAYHEAQGMMGKVIVS